MIVLSSSIENSYSDSYNLTDTHQLPVVSKSYNQHECWKSLQERLISWRRQHWASLRPAILFQYVLTLSESWLWQETMSEHLSEVHGCSDHLEVDLYVSLQRSSCIAQMNDVHERLSYWLALNGSSTQAKIDACEPWTGKWLADRSDAFLCDWWSFTTWVWSMKSRLVCYIKTVMVRTHERYVVLLIASRQIRKSLLRIGWQSWVKWRISSSTALDV